MIGYFEIYINDIAQNTTIAPDDLKFSAGGFAGGESYEVHVVAYPKENNVEFKPRASNKKVNFSIMFSI